MPFYVCFLLDEPLLQIKGEPKIVMSVIVIAQQPWNKH